MVSQTDIALIIYSLQGGGAERVMVSLATAMSSRGFRVDLVLCRAEGPLLQEVPDAVSIVDCGTETSNAWRSCVEAYFKDTRPQTALASMEAAGVVTLLARIRAKVPCRVAVVSQNTFSRHTRSAKGFKERRLLPWMVRWLFRRAEGIIAVSDGVADDLAKTAWLPRGRVRVIPNPGVTDAVLSKAETRVDYPWLPRNGEPLIVSAGRLTAQKDFPTLLGAFALLNKADTHRLVVMGEGEDRTSLEELARDLGIAEQVTFPGFVENPWAVFSRADLFVMSSRWEGFPLVLVEAMACGCPVVSTDCPNGPSEILGGGVFGQLAPVGDTQAVAAAMSETLENPPSPEVLKDRAREFHIDPITDSYLRVMGLPLSP